MLEVSDLNFFPVRTLNKLHILSWQIFLNRSLDQLFNQIQYVTKTMNVSERNFEFAFHDAIVVWYWDLSVSVKFASSN